MVSLLFLVGNEGMIHNNFVEKTYPGLTSQSWDFSQFWGCDCDCHMLDLDFLVGGLEHEFYDFPYIGNNHTNWRIHIFQMGWNHQPVKIGVGMVYACNKWRWTIKTCGAPIKHQGSIGQTPGCIYVTIQTKLGFNVIHICTISNHKKSGWSNWNQHIWWWETRWFHTIIGYSQLQMLHCLESHARDPKVEIPGRRGKPLGLLTSKVLVLLTCLVFHCFKQCLIKFICFRNCPMFGGSSLYFQTCFFSTFPETAAGWNGRATYNCSSTAWTPMGRASQRSAGWFSEWPLGHPEGIWLVVWICFYFSIYIYILGIIIPTDRYFSEG